MAIFPVVYITSGVIDILNDREVKLYPNPAKNEFTVDFSSYKHTNATIEVYNMSGKLVDRILSNGLTDKMVIDISKENPGIYIVNIKLPKELL